VFGRSVELALIERLLDALPNASLAFSCLGDLCDQLEDEVFDGLATPQLAAIGAGCSGARRRRLYLDGNQIGEGRLDATIPIGFSADETTDVGRDTGSRVVPDYKPGSAFTGTINWVAIEVGDDDHNHLITPEQQLAYHLAQH
jgi:hypothetical protein